MGEKVAKAMFKAAHEGMGLSQANVAGALKVDVRTVKRWERPGEAAPPKFAWDYLEDLQAAFDQQVSDAVSGIEAMTAENGMPGKVTLTYYRTQEDYDRFGRDNGPFGFRNAMTREVAQLLKNRGYRVEFAYPADEQ